MDITNQFLILSTSKKTLSFDSPIPCFCILALLIDMEINNIISLNENEDIVIDSNIPALTKAQQMLIDVIDENNLKDIRGILNHFLRTLTFKELKQITDSLMSDIESTNENVTFTKGKLISPDSLLHQCTSAISKGDNNAAILSALLYGCRVLKQYTDKQAYKDFVVTTKHGINFEPLPLTTFIIKNIDLIRGHIMGLVAN